MFNALSNIAIFILATTAKNTKNDQQQTFPTYYESRISPIAMTWASLVPQTYFVFGTNQYDYEFLSKTCELQESYPAKTNSRSLRATSPQMPESNTFGLYNCPISSAVFNNYSTMNTSQHDLIPSFHALYVGNCTGEYFGGGPTCRCQESMRWYLTDSRFRDMEWFMFMDDDVYIRPAIFSQFLHLISSNETFSKHPSAIISTIVSAGIKNIRLRHSNGTYLPLSEECKRLWDNSFFYAQPAIINRLAMQRMRPMVEQLGMMHMQQIWGGSHDSVLGMILWMYDIHIFSLASSYSGNAINAEFLLTTKKLNPRQNKWRDGLKSCMMFHRVLNLRFPSKVTKKILLEDKSSSTTQLTIWKAYASQFDISTFLKENYKYFNHSISQSMNTHSFNNAVSEHDKIMAKELATSIIETVLVRLGPSTINQTIFKLVHPTFPQMYFNFTPQHCTYKKPIV